MQSLPFFIGQVMGVQVIYTIATAGVLARELLRSGNTALNQLSLGFM